MTTGMVDAYHALALMAILFVWMSAAAFINAKYWKLPEAIGQMLCCAIFSGIIMVGSKVGFINPGVITDFLKEFDIQEIVLAGMLHILLFASGLHFPSARLYVYRGSIGLLATVGVLVAAFITAFLLWLGVSYIITGATLSFIVCLMFGSFIAATDAVAANAILEKATKDEALKSKIIGESLFNDATSVVMVLVVAGIYVSGHGVDKVNYMSVAGTLLKEIFGGAFIGLACAALTTYMLRQIDQTNTEVMMIIALALGSYSLAVTMHVSAPIAAVVAGLYIGNRARDVALSKKTQEQTDNFFGMVDSIFNNLLFGLIGASIVLLEFSYNVLALGGIAIVAMLIGRYLSVLLCSMLLTRQKFKFSHMPAILTWAGLRGGISIALALSLPEMPEKQTLLTVTYMVVLFSIIFQGLTLGKVIAYFEEKNHISADHAEENKILAEADANREEMRDHLIELAHGHVHDEDTVSASNHVDRKTGH